MPIIDALPTPPPSRDDPENFAARGDSTMGHLPTLITQMNAAVDLVLAAAATAADDAATAAAEAAATSILGSVVMVTGAQNVGGIKTFTSMPILPGNASAALHPVPKQQLDTAIAAYFEPGTRLAFAQAAAPVGWTQDTTDNADNRMLRVVKTAGNGIAGSHSPILNNVVPAHTHGFTTGAVSADHTHNIGDPGHSHTYIQGQPAVGAGASIGNSLYGYSASTSAVATGVWTGGISANHSHSGGTDNGSSQTNWTPRYIDLIICAKD